MANRGSLVATTLVFSLIVSAAPALAVDVPHELPSAPVPTIPALPPPPVNAGACFQYAQVHLNAVTGEASDARDIAFLLFAHESAEATLLFAEVSQSLTPDEDDIVGTYQGLTGSTSSVLNLVAALPLVLGQGTGEALEKMVTGTGIVAVAIVPIVPDQVAVLVPYTGERYQAAFDPILAFNSQTNLGHLTAEPTLVITWGVDYVLLQASAGAVPLMPANEGAEGASDGASLGLEGAAALAWAVNRASDNSVRTMVGVVDAGAPLAEGTGDQAEEAREASEVRAGSMTSFAREDLDLLRIHLEGSGDRLAARSEAFPGDAPGCPALSL